MRPKAGRRQWLSGAVGPRQAGGHHLCEGAGTVADRVFGVFVHFTEGFLPARRAEHRVIAEALVAARRPHRLPVHTAHEGFRMTVRPAQAQRGDEPGARSVASAVSAYTRAMAAAKSFVGPAQRAECTPGWPFSAATQKPESSDSAGNPLARAAACALMRALPTKSGASSAGSGRPRAPADTSAMPKGASSASISRSLPGL